MERPSPPLVMGAAPGAPRPNWRDLAAAFAILTPIPGPKADVRAPLFARATLFFPLVGLLLGSTLAIIERSFGHLGSGLMPGLVVVIWTALSWPTFAPNAASALALGARGGLVLLKLLLLSGLVHAQATALLVIPVIARWAIVVLAIGARDANHAGRKLNPGISFREFGWTSVFAGAVLAWSLEALGVLVFVASAALILATRLLSHRLAGGVSWAGLCTSVHGLEVAILALFVVIGRTMA